LKGRVHVIAARIARTQGNWELSRQEVAQALECGVPASEALRYLPRVSTDPSTAIPENGEAKVRKLLAGRSIRRLKPGQLRQVLDIALQYKLGEVATEVI